MTWTAFFQAFRKGIAERAVVMTRPRSRPQQSMSASGNHMARSASNQDVPATQQTEKSPFEEWDYMVVDVSAASFYFRSSSMAYLIEHPASTLKSLRSSIHRSSESHGFFLRNGNKCRLQRKSFRYCSTTLRVGN